MIIYTYRKRKIHCCNDIMFSASRHVWHEGKHHVLSKRYRAVTLKGNVLHLHIHTVCKWNTLSIRPLKQNYNG